MVGKPDELFRYEPPLKEGTPDGTDARLATPKYSSPFLPTSLWSAATRNSLPSQVGVGGKEKGSKGILHPTPPASESWVVTSSAQPVQECHTAYLNPSPASSMP